jgi:parvulin-like peptidyl-prolyl isomerase
MRRLSISAVGLLFIVLLVFGCRPNLISEKNIDEFDYVVVQADGDFSLSMRQVYDSLYHSELAPYGGIIRKDVVREIIDSIVVDTLIGLRAQELDLCQYPDDRRKLDSRSNELLIKLFFDEMASKKVTVDSLEVVEHFKSNQGMYWMDERILTSVMNFKYEGLLTGPDSLKYRGMGKEELKQALKDYAYSVHGLLGKDRSFSSVAKEYSHDDFTGRRGGMLGWTKRGLYYDPFDSVAFSLQSDQYSQPYEDADGWHIVYVGQRVDEGVPEYSEPLYQLARNNLKTLKANSLGVKIKDSLSQLEVSLTINDEIIGGNVFVLDPFMWAAIVNDVDTIMVYSMRTLEQRYRDNYDVANTNAEMKRLILETLSEWYVWLQAAREVGIDTLPEFVQQRQTWEHDTKRGIVESLRSSVGWTPSDSIIDEYYEDYLKKQSGRKPMVVQHILCEDSVFCEFLRDQAQSGIDFMELARQYYPGDADMRESLANLGEIGPEDVEPEFYKAAFGAAEGQVTRPVKTKYGYHIIKVLDHYTRPDKFQVKMKITPVLKRQHADEIKAAFKDGLYSRYNVKFSRQLYDVHLKPLAYRIEQDI